MVIKVFFTVLVLCTTAVVAVFLAIHFRVKHHLSQEHVDSQVRPVIEGVAENTAQENPPKQSS